MKVWPDVGVSSPAMQCSSVDFPDPDGPMIALNRPAANWMSTPSSARTAASPDPYTFRSPTARAAVPPVRGGPSAADVVCMASSPVVIDPVEHTGSPRTSQEWFVELL